MPLDSVVFLRPRRFTDARGWFSETYNERALAQRGITTRFVQDNHSYSGPVGTLRGLHFQRPPHAQAKLVRCVRGIVYDVVVDLRRGSPTYSQWEAVKLTASGGEQLYLPVGFAHGFVTLTPDAEIMYKVSDFYAPECDGGIRWDDPMIAVNWPVPPSGPLLSDKDAKLPYLKDFDSPFNYDGVPLTPLLADA